MIRSPIGRPKDDEIPISPTPDSSVPEIFSTKKVFFLNTSCSGSRRSEIPHIETEYYPRNEVSRRLFHQSNNSCDCDCASDGCWGCLRRNKQCFCRVFVLILSVLLVILLFGSLSYNLTRKKDGDETLEIDVKTEWVSHDHYYNLSEEKKVSSESARSDFKLNLPVPIYETPDYFESDVDFHKHHYQVIDQTPEEIEPLSYPALSTQKLDSRDPALIINDGREPSRSKRSIFPISRKYSGTINSQKEKHKTNEDYKKGHIKRKSITTEDEDLNDIDEDLKKYLQKFMSNAHTVFQPFSLATPSVQSDEYFLEENNIEEESKVFADQPTVQNFDWVTKVWNDENSVDSTDETTDGVGTEGVSGKEAKYDSIGRYVEGNLFSELLGFNEEKGKAKSEEIYTQIPRIFITTDGYRALTTTEMTKGSDVVTNTEIYEDVEHSEGLRTLNETFRGDATDSIDNATSDFMNKNEFRTFSNLPLIQVAMPLAELFGLTKTEESPVQWDRVKGISLAEAKKIKKDRRKQLLLNSRVVGGSSDVRLPTGPDVSKPFVNALETIKTNQQVSFTPSAATQYVLPYQMCFYPSPALGPKTPFHTAQPRTYPFRPSPFFPPLFEKEPSPPPPPPHKESPPAQQNFLSFSINNFASGPPNRPYGFPSGSSFFNIPPQQQFPYPNRQPIFCTYLQPPLFQFPTVPGTADFNHAKCVDCDDDTPKQVPFSRERIHSSGVESICPDDKIPCRDGSSCIPINNWCDNGIHCKDASDEAFCSCRDRVARERLCDGYVDCPHGEDEVGCFDCPKSAFSCDSVISPESCIPLSKRCDGRRDCSTGADEAECSALFFNVRQNDSYHVSQTSGYLHRNWKGDWFPVCVEIGDDIWAHEACSGELGMMSQQVEVSYAQVPGHYKGPFIVRQDGISVLQDHCKGHVSTYVKCPEITCGTRVEFPNLREFDTRFRRFVQNNLHVGEVPFVTWWNNFGGKNISDNLTLTDIQVKVNENKEIKEPGTKSKREETGRVVGGKESDPRAWPWAIAVYKDGAFHCGGVILDENWVLTAAHCMEQYWKHFYEVRGGMLRRFSFSAMEQPRSVSHVIIHESYNPTIMSNDLAVLRLQEPFKFNRWVRPACLPILQDNVSKFLYGPVPGTRCIAVGWGALRERGSDPDQLREVEIPIMSTCKHKEDVAGAEICAGKVEGGKDTCQGDSGGPLLCRDSDSPPSWYVAGIVSHGEGCARPGEPGAYTRISLFLDWISANTNDFQLPSIKPLNTCPGFRCHSGNRLCIPLKWVCNGFVDCLEAEDEKNCSSSFMMSDIMEEQYSGPKKFARPEDSGGELKKITTPSTYLKFDGLTTSDFTTTEQTTHNDTTKAQKKETVDVSNYTEKQISSKERKETDNNWKALLNKSVAGATKSYPNLNTSVIEKDVTTESLSTNTQINKNLSTEESSESEDQSLEKTGEGQQESPIEENLETNKEAKILSDVNNKVTTTTSAEAISSEEIKTTASLRSSVEEISIKKETEEINDSSSEELKTVELSVATDATEKKAKTVQELYKEIMYSESFSTDRNEAAVINLSESFQSYTELYTADETFTEPSVGELENGDLEDREEVREERMFFTENVEEKSMSFERERTAEIPYIQSNTESTGGIKEVKESEKETTSSSLELGNRELFVTNEDLISTEEFSTKTNQKEEILNYNSGEPKSLTIESLEIKEEIFETHRNLEGSERTPERETPKSVGYNEETTQGVSNLEGSERTVGIETPENVRNDEETTEGIRNLQTSVGTLERETAEVVENNEETTEEVGNLEDSERAIGIEIPENVRSDEETTEELRNLETSVRTSERKSPETVGFNEETTQEVSNLEDSERTVGVETPENVRNDEETTEELRSLESSIKTSERKTPETVGYNEETTQGLSNLEDSERIVRIETPEYVRNYEETTEALRNLESSVRTSKGETSEIVDYNEEITQGVSNLENSERAVGMETPENVENNEETTERLRHLEGRGRTPEGETPDTVGIKEEITQGVSNLEDSERTVGIETPEFLGSNEETREVLENLESNVRAPEKQTAETEGNNEETTQGLLEDSKGSNVETTEGLRNLEDSERTVGLENPETVGNNVETTEGLRNLASNEEAVATSEVSTAVVEIRAKGMVFDEDISSTETERNSSIENPMEPKLSNPAGTKTTEVYDAEKEVSVETAVREEIWSKRTKAGEETFQKKDLIETKEVEETTTLTWSPHSIQSRETARTDMVLEEFSTLKSVVASHEISTKGLSDTVKRNSLQSKARTSSGYYQCEEIVQSVLARYRCDGIIDCEDGTDERNCTCADRLLQTSPGLICDGQTDCADLSDENNCSPCSEHEFYCKLSRECISLEERCNGEPKCKFGEDEDKCLALTANSTVVKHANGDPFFLTKGFLMSNKNGTWSVECQEESSFFGAREAIKVCSNIGTIGYDMYENKTLAANCTGFEVKCANNLVSSLKNYKTSDGGYFWPWNAFVYSDSVPICTAVLLQPEWLLTSTGCVKNIELEKNYLTAKLGGKTSIPKFEEFGAEMIRIDAIRNVPKSDMTLLHISKRVNQTEYIRPIGIPYIFDSNPEKDLCVAVGNRTIFLKISEDCDETLRCYNKLNDTSLNCRSKQWSGVIVCQSRLGWYPSSVYHERSGLCGFRNVRYSSVEENLNAIQFAMGTSVEPIPEPKCPGFRCPEGACISSHKVCDGRPDCRSKKDEDPQMCRKKKRKECEITEMKCRNDVCVPKSSFADGTDDCGDGSDEPEHPTCLEYLRLTAPHRICDGKRNCFDKTDENPEMCLCDDSKFECTLSQVCVPKDFVCDGEKDCPRGEDEQHCIGRKNIKNYKKNHLEIMQRSYGMWHTICHPAMSKESSDTLCRDLGLKEAVNTYERNQTVLVPKVDSFSWVKLNPKTSIALRGDKPFVSLVKLKRTCTAVKCT